MNLYNYYNIKETQIERNIYTHTYMCLLVSVYLKSVMSLLFLKCIYECIYISLIVVIIIIIKHYFIYLVINILEKFYLKNK